jgi:hypothetical protein
MWIIEPKRIGAESTAEKKPLKTTVVNPARPGIDFGRMDNDQLPVCFTGDWPLFKKNADIHRVTSNGLFLII